MGFQNHQGVRQVVEDGPRFSDAGSGRRHGSVCAVQTETVIIAADKAFRPANGARPVFPIVDQQPVP